MTTERVIFRCDGDERVGAGHVARCLQVALAFDMHGVQTVFVGHYSGVAGELLRDAGAWTEEPAATAAGVPHELAGPVVVDSYEIPAEEVESLGAERPVAVLGDGGPAPAVAAFLCYHLDAAEHAEVPEGTRAVFGVDYAPARAECVRARRHRGFRNALVSLGGGGHGRAVLREAVEALAQLDLRVYAAGHDPAAVLEGLNGQVSAGFERGGLAARIRWADVAVSGAGSTPYDLACAGVPALLLALADNQVPVAGAFDSAGIALSLDVRAGADGLRAAIGRLADAELRERMAGRGPELVDGYGAFRARDALLAAFEGRPAPRVLRYRPARHEDADLLRTWRNDPAVRSVSRRRDPVRTAEHAHWFAASMASPSRMLLVIEDSGEPVGTVRLDRRRDFAEISVTIAEEHRSTGVGTQAVREAAELFLASHRWIRAVLAEIQPSNRPSLVAFGRAGYRETDAVRPPEGSVLLALDRTGLAASLF